MFTLNLPVTAHKIRQHDGKRQIFDPFRKRFVALTPEEWVRQNFSAYLVACKGYPPGRMVHECRISLHGMDRRCDAVVYDEHLNPLAVLEYKSPDVKVEQSVFEQIASYNWVLKVPFLMVSNGLQHVVCRLDYEQQTMQYWPDIPSYDELLAKEESKGRVRE